MRNARRDAWQAYAERRGGGRVPIGAVRASTEAHHLVLAGLTANVVVDIPEPPRPRGRRISGTGVFRVLISVSVFRGWRRISGNAIDEVFAVHARPRGAPMRANISAERRRRQWAAPGLGKTCQCADMCSPYIVKGVTVFADVALAGPRRPLRPQRAWRHRCTPTRSRPPMPTPLQFTDEEKDLLLTLAAPVAYGSGRSSCARWRLNSRTARAALARFTASGRRFSAASSSRRSGSRPSADRSAGVQAQSKQARAHEAFIEEP